MDAKEQSKTSSSPHRWLLTMFLLGLAIGVHLLGILVIPSIGYFIYFRYTKNVTLKGIIITAFSGFYTWVYSRRCYPRIIATSSFEVAFVNSRLHFIPKDFFLRIIDFCLLVHNTLCKRKTTPFFIT